MKFTRIDNRGFSLTELMFAMTIMAVGLLALAQMQMMAVRGTVSAREFSVATKIAREGMERYKVSGVYIITADTPYWNNDTIIVDHDKDHNDEASMAPDIDTTTNPASLRYDVVEVFREDPGNPMSLVDPICGPRKYPQNCNSTLANDEDWDYVRITNQRNWPSGSDENSRMKEISTVVLWKERGLTRSVSLRTLIGVKDSAFF